MRASWLDNLPDSLWLANQDNLFLNLLCSWFVNVKDLISKQFIKANDDEDSVRLKMLAVIADEVPSIDHILLHCLNQINPEDSMST